MFCVSVQTILRESCTQTVPCSPEFNISHDGNCFLNTRRPTYDLVLSDNDIDYVLYERCLDKLEEKIALGGKLPAKQEYIDLKNELLQRESNLLKKRVHDRIVQDTTDEMMKFNADIECMRRESAERIDARMRRFRARSYTHQSDTIDKYNMELLEIEKFGRREFHLEEFKKSLFRSTIRCFTLPELLQIQANLGRYLKPRSVCVYNAKKTALLDKALQYFS